MKELTCRDIGVDCDAKFNADTEEGIMVLAAEHAASGHNLPVIPPHIDQKCRAAIKEVPGSASDQPAV